MKTITIIGTLLLLASVGFIGVQAYQAAPLSILIVLAEAAVATLVLAGIAHVLWRGRALVFKRVLVLTLSLLFTWWINGKALFFSIDRDELEAAVAKAPPSKEFEAAVNSGTLMGVMLQEIQLLQQPYWQRMMNRLQPLALSSVDGALTAQTVGNPEALATMLAHATEKIVYAKTVKPRMQAELAAMDAATEAVLTRWGIVGRERDDFFRNYYAKVNPTLDATYSMIDLDIAFYGELSETLNFLADPNHRLQSAPS